MVFSTAGSLAANEVGQGLRIRRLDPLNFFYRITQTLAWLLFLPLFYIFYDISIYGKENFLSAPKPLIIIANHIGFYDSFLLNIAAGFYCKHRPFRYMAVRQFDWAGLNFLAKIGLIDFIYKFFGVFTVTPGLGLEKNLDTPKQILQEKGTVVIYPEGSIVMDNKIIPFRKGAAVLSLNSNVPILPVSFRRGERLFLRRNIYINIGKIIYPDNQTADVLTSKLYQSVSELYIKSPHFWVYENN
jgi:long-chain acyl-CoA synthetase